MLKKLFTPKIRILWLLIAILCFLYSIAVRMVGSGTLSFLIWITGTVFFLLCYYFAGNGRWARVPKFLRRTFYVLLTVGLVIFLSCETAIMTHYFDKGEKDLDYVIVLGAQMRSYGPSVIYAYRLGTAKEYLDENPGTICITTGGQGKNENISEGEGGANHLISLGIPSDRIEIETESTDTVENIKNALEIIEAREGSVDNLKIGIVTNGFHVFRGVHIAQKLTDAEICGIAAPMQPQYIPNNMVREAIGIMRDFFLRKI